MTPFPRLTNPVRDENASGDRLTLIALTVMRTAVGWHFLYEGLAKLLKGNWSAAGYLLQSKWVLAPVFKWMANTPAVLNVVNLMNIWGLIAVGLGLITGAFTRLAAVAGMLLILLYYVCNPPLPGLYYSIPMEGNYLVVNKNVVELAALLVIAVTSTGRFAGVDRLLAKAFRKRSPKS
jgi:thiosulfate dehydrogenase [quinone] large subunit